MLKHKRRLTPTPQGATCIPPGPIGQTRTLAATIAAQEAALRLSRFAVTTPLSREPALAGAGPCLKRGRMQHADGCLVSTRSCTAAPVSVATTAARLVRVRLPPLLRGGAGVARHNPIHHALADGPAFHSHAVATDAAQRAMEQRVGLSGRLPKSPSRGIQGPGSSCCCHCCGAAVAAVATVAARRRRAPQSDSPGATCSSIPIAERGRYAPSAAATVAKFAVVRPQSEGRPQALRRPRVPATQAIAHVSCRRGPSSSGRSRSSC